MSPRLHPLLALALIGGTIILVSNASAEIPAMARDAHNELQQALNSGGPTPSDEDRTTHLKAALEDLKSLPASRGTTRAQYLASGYIKSAIYEIAHGGTPNQIANDIRQADSIVRDIDG